METSSRNSLRMPYSRLEPASDHRLELREDETSCLNSHERAKGDVVSGHEAETVHDASSPSSSSFPSLSSSSSLSAHERLTVPLDSDTKRLLPNGSSDNAFNVLHTRHSYSPDRKPSHNSNSGKVCVENNRNYEKFSGIHSII